MVKVTWSLEAIEDLRLIKEYISLDSEFYANRLINKVVDRVSALQLQPYIGRVVPEYGDSSNRELLEHPYRIIYKLVSDDEPSIAKIYHTARLLL